MKNIKLYVVLAVALSLGVGTFVYAENATSSGVRQQIKEIKTTAANQINQIRVEDKYNRITNRFQATVDRLDNIIGRLETRIAKMKAGGMDTSAAEKIVTDAKKSISDAKTSMTALQTNANLADELANASTTTKEIKASIVNLQKASNNTLKLLKQTHVSLLKSIGILKGLKVGQSTTPKSN